MSYRVIRGSANRARKETQMGFKVFRDDWERLESGELYLSDCTGLDRLLDRELIEYLALHCREGWWVPKFLRRYGIDKVFLAAAENEDPEGIERAYRVLREQVAREEDRDVLKRAAFTGRNDIGRFAFCYLTGYRWDPRDYGPYTYQCGLKNDMLREDIEAFCREMIEKDGPFSREAEEWLAKLPEIPDETMDEWAEGESDRYSRQALSVSLHGLLRPSDGPGALHGEELEEKLRSIFDAYIMMVYEERCGKVTRSKKAGLMDPFTRDIYEIMKKLIRERVPDEAAAVAAVLYAGGAMGQEISPDRIREVVWSESDGSPQHSFFLGLACEHGIGTEPDGEKADAMFRHAADGGFAAAL